MSQDVKPLPRGLISREGTPVQKSQRLPSLRNRPSLTSTPSTPVSAINGPKTSDTTRGGAAKRVFKPSIPSRRQPSDTAASTSSSESKRGRDSNRTPRGRGRGGVRGKPPPGKPNYVQLEAAVFSGINASVTNKSSVPSSGSSVVRVSNDRIKSEPSFSTPQKSKLSLDSSTEKFEVGDDEDTSTIYADSFIDDASDDERTSSNKLPRGWENCQAESRNRSSNSKSFVNESSGIPTDKWLTADDNLVLIQVPEILTHRSSGVVGKLKVYKSGRVELVDNEAGLTFDVIRANNNPIAMLPVKQEIDRGKRVQQKPISTENRQELVLMKDNTLTCLGSLPSCDVLISVPRIPD